MTSPGRKIGIEIGKLLNKEIRGRHEDATEKEHGERNGKRIGKGE